MAVHNFLVVEGYMPSEIRYTEPNALAPLTGFAKIYTLTKDPFSIGEPLTLVVYELDEDAGTWQAVDYVSDVYVKRQNTLTTGERFYQVEIDFEDSIGIVMEEEIVLDSDYFDSNKGLHPTTVIAAIMAGSTYGYDLTSVSTDFMRIRDFQFKGTRADAIHKFEKCIGARAIVNRDSLKLKFVPAYHDTSAACYTFSSANIFSPLQESSTYIVSDGVEVTGMLNTPSSSGSSTKAYHLGNDCWAVWLNSTPTESAQGSTYVEGWVRANIHHPDVINVVSPPSAGVSNIRVDGTLVDIPIWGPSNFTTLTGEPNSDFVVVTSAISLEFYRRVDLVVDAPDIMSQMTNAYLASAAKTAKSCDFQFTLNNAQKQNIPFSAVAGSPPREVIQTNDPCSAEAAQRCADIKSQGKGYQWETIVEPHTSGVYRPGRRATLGGSNFIVEEVTVTSPPYDVRVKLLEEVT